MTIAPLRATVPAPDPLTDETTRLFEALAADVAPSFAVHGRLPTAGERTRELIDTLWPAARVVSFDIFDTLVVRKVAAPRDVFLHLATPAPFREWGLEAVPLAEHRIAAEMTARREGVAARGSGEVTLHEIHSALATRLQRPASDVPAMVAAERLVERALCVAHPFVKTLLERAVRDGKQVWCVSDTWHEAAFLRELLASCGLDAEAHVVVSSGERRMAKGEGKLLAALADELGVPRGEVLHIGDHAQSDHAIPLQQGFMAVLHPWAASRHDDAPASQPGDSVVLGLSQLCARTPEPAFPFWWRFGYAVAGPLLSGFASWLHQSFTSDGVQRAYFLLRDGEIMLDVYSALLGERAGPQVSLLESSRRAFILPAFESGNASVTAQLLACEHARPAGEFLERLGLRASEFAASMRAVGLDSAARLIARDDADGMRKVAALFSRRDVVQAMVTRGRTERTALWRYLKQEGVLDTGRIALVDIGWNGTIQKALMAMAPLERTPLDLVGYYLGTQPAIAQDLGGSTARGYLFDAGAPLDRARTMQQLQQLVEFICTTARGSLRGFRMDGARAVPVHGTVDHPPEQHEAITQLRAGAVAYARGLAQERTVFGEQPISPVAAMRPLARVILQPTAEEAAMIGDIRHGEGLGADRVRALAAFSPGEFTTDSLRRDYAGAYWKTGLLARREPAALALRALLWMDGA